MAFIIHLPDKQYYGVDSLKKYALLAALFYIFRGMAEILFK